jgi:uncharacterized repeat protein (TIGR01451 family)
VPWARFFPDSKISYAENLLHRVHKKPDDPAIDRTKPSDIDVDSQTGDEDDSDIAVIQVGSPVVTTTTTGPTTTTTGPATTTTIPAGVTTTTAGPAGSTTTTAPTDDVADLVLTKNVTQKPGSKEAVWTLKVVNDGPGIAVGPIVITDTLPAGLEFVRAASGAVTCELDGTKVICTKAGNLAVGESISVDIVTNVNAAAGAVITNNATVAGKNNEITKTNNDDAATLTPNDPSLIDLALAKSASAMNTAGVVNWTLQVSNLGADDDGVISVTDKLPSTLKFKSFSGQGWSCQNDQQTVTCRRAEGLAAGEVSAVVLSTEVAAPAGSVVNNTATVSSTAQEKTLDNNTGSDSIEVPASQVAGQNQNPVAFTGANSLRLAAAALLFVMGGLALVFTRRRSIH